MTYILVGECCLIKNELFQEMSCVYIIKFIINKKEKPLVSPFKKYILLNLIFSYLLLKLKPFV